MYRRISRLYLDERDGHCDAKGRHRRESKNKKQETKRFSTFAVYRLRHSETKKNIAWFENQVLAEHVRKSQSTIYLKSHGCVHGLQNEMSLINFSTMFCKPCSLSRNRSLRDAKSARHMFVWFAKHCLAEHCLSFRGDADECKKQFCFVFRICLAFFWLSSVAALRHNNRSVHASQCETQCLYWPYIVEYAVSRYIINPLMFIVVYRHNN